MPEKRLQAASAGEQFERRRRRRGGGEEEENKVGQRTRKQDGTQHAFV
jgi:hypothetical protein